MSTEFYHATSQFDVWHETGLEPEVAPRTYYAANAANAAEQHAREDWDDGQRCFPRVYRALDKRTGEIWEVPVAVVDRPSLEAAGAHLIPMTAATHVLWGGHVLCEDLRLRGVPAEWPEGQRWVSLTDVRDGVEIPPDRCPTCWDKAPEVVAGIRRMSKQ